MKKWAREWGAPVTLGALLLGGFYNLYNKIDSVGERISLQAQAQASAILAMQTQIGNLQSRIGVTEGQLSRMSYDPASGEAYPEGHLVQPIQLPKKQPKQ